MVEEILPEHEENQDKKHTAIISTSSVDDGIKTGSQSCNNLKILSINQTMKKWMLACSYSNLEEIKDLLKEEPSLLNTKDPLWGMTCIHWAIKNHNKHVFDYLISVGADINAKMKNGDTPLHLVEKYNHADMYEKLNKTSSLKKETSNFNNHIPYQISEQLENHPEKQKKTSKKSIRKFFSMRDLSAKDKLLKFKLKNHFKSSKIESKSDLHNTGSTIDIPNENNNYTSYNNTNSAIKSTQIYKKNLIRSTTVFRNDSCLEAFSGYLDSYTNKNTKFTRLFSEQPFISQQKNLKRTIISTNTLNPEHAISTTFRDSSQTTTSLH